MASNSSKLASQDENGDILFDYDPSATEGFTLLNTGYYRGVIEDCPVKPGAAAPYLAVRFRADPQPGRVKGRVVFENVSFKAQWKLTQLRAAIYGPQEAGETRLNPMEIQGQSVVVYITQQPDTRSGHQGEMQNNIARFVPLNEAETVTLYDWAEEMATEDSAPEAALAATDTGGWGDLPGGEEASTEAVVDARHTVESEEDLVAAMKDEDADADEIPFEDEQPEPAPARRSPAPAAASKKAASKKVTPRRR